MTDLTDKQKLCQGRCNYSFQAIKTTTKEPITDNANNEQKVEEQIDEAILFCTVCAHCEHISFE